MTPSITFKPNRPPRFSRKGAALLTSLTIVLILTLYLTHRHPSLPTLETIPWIPTRFPSDTRIAKATIAYTPLSNDRSLALHSTHNAAFGYEMHVLRRPIVRGFANTLLWLQHLIVSEMLKNVEERVEWIMFFNPGTALLSNPRIPLHTFVPPHTLSYHDAFKSLTIIAAKLNSNDVSTYLFFIRVSTLSIRFLTLALSAVYDASERDWGSDIVGKAMQEVLEREEWREKVVWVPREWWEVGFKRVEGVLEVEDVLGKLEEQGRNKEETLEMYPSEEEVGGFWNGVVEAKQVLVEAMDKGYAKEDGEFAQEYRDVKDAVELWTWDLEGMKRKVEILKEVMHIGEVIGYEAMAG